MFPSAVINGVLIQIFIGRVVLTFLFLIFFIEFFLFLTLVSNFGLGATILWNMNEESYSNLVFLYLSAKETLIHLSTAILIYIFLCFIVYIWLTKPNSFFLVENIFRKYPKCSRVLIVIAHPDDVRKNNNITNKLFIKSFYFFSGMYVLWANNCFIG